MGVSCVTITIEEFERLIKAKRKLDKMVELKDNHIKAIIDTSRKGKRAVNNGDIESLENLISEQDNKNLIYMADVIKILESEDE